MHFEELADRTAAEAVRGIRLLTDVPTAQVPTDDDEFYDRQLVGLLARLASGEEVGRVTSVLHLPSQDVLEIQTPTGVRLVPFVEALVPEVDLAAGSVTIADVEGLLSDQDGA